MDELQPQTFRERNLVEMMAVEWWHLGQCEFLRRSFFSNQRKIEQEHHQGWAEMTPEEQLQWTGENIAFYHLKDMVRISDLKSRVTRSYHRASREFDRLREDRLRRQAEPQPESQPQPQPVEPPAGPQPVPDPAGAIHHDAPPDVPAAPSPEIPPLHSAGDHPAIGLAGQFPHQSDIRTGADTGQPACEFLRESVSRQPDFPITEN
jgi:hypothetical protein